MANGITPPAGLTLDPTPTSSPSITPPPGLTLDSSPADQGTGAPQAAPEGFMTSMVSGMLESAADTAHGAANLAEKATGGTADKQVVPAMQTPPVRGYSVPLRTDTQGTKVGDEGTVGHAVGEGAENVGEFMAGDAALESASKFLKIAQRFPEVVPLMEKYPKAAKILLGTGKAATVGAAQGAVKGAAEGKTVEGAEGGAIGGAIGGAAGETASQVLGDVLKQFGVGTTAEQKGMQALKPSKGNVDFIDDFKKSSSVIDSLPDWKNAKDAKEGVEAIRSARQNWWQQEVQPWIDKDPNVPLSGTGIQKGILDRIPRTMRASEKAEMERTAQEFAPQGNISMAAPGSSAFTPVSNIPIKDAEEWIEHYNAELSATGFWNKTSQERNALLQTNGQIAGWKAAGDALRDELYNRIGILNPGIDMADKKDMYGALRNVENQLQGRVNVEGRQAPISLKQAIGLAAGLSMGRLEGLAAVALPMIDRSYNSATKLAQRGVKQAATGSEGPIAEAAKTAVKGIPSVTEPAGAGLGRVYFTSSDGGQHSIPNDPEAIKQAVQIDPNIQFTKQ